MSAASLSSLSNAELVRRFAEISRKQLGCLELSDIRGYNRLYDRKDAIEAVLKSRGAEARLELAPLLEDPDLHVRFNAAHALLSLCPARARAALEEIAKDPSITMSGRAGMSLLAIDGDLFKPADDS